MGTRRVENSASIDLGDLEVVVPSTPRLEYVCPPGALTQLEPHQAYIALSTGYRSPGVIWLAGNHEKAAPEAESGPPINGTSQVESLARLRAAVLEPVATSVETKAGDGKDIAMEDFPKESETANAYYDVSVWTKLLSHPRFKKASVPNLRDALQGLGHEPSGLPHVPKCWWDCVVCYLKAHPRQPGEILHLSQRSGFLEIVLHNVPTSEALEWITRLRLSVYPSRARPLTARDYRLKIALERIGGWPPTGWKVNSIGGKEKPAT